MPEGSPLARVEGGRNLVVSTGEFGGETTFGGHGAGGDPTAVAVVSDRGSGSPLGCSRGIELPGRDAAVACEFTNDLEAPHYLRFVVRDQPGIIAAVGSVLAGCDINLDAVLQKPGHYEIGSALRDYSGALRARSSLKLRWRESPGSTFWPKRQ